MHASTEVSARRTSPLGKMPYLVGGAVIGAFAVLLAGSYGTNWTWTGFKANGTLWEWLNLLLLPLAVGTLPLWYGDLEERGPWWSRWWVWALAALCVAFLIVTVCGYADSWGGPESRATRTGTG
jgi:peptidoglycan/LPS O-acetylase OafA/YrhL